MTDAEYKNKVATISARLRGLFAESRQLQATMDGERENGQAAFDAHSGEFHAAATRLQPMIEGELENLQAAVDARARELREGALQLQKKLSAADPLLYADLIDEMNVAADEARDVIGRATAEAKAAMKAKTERPPDE